MAAASILDFQMHEILFADGVQKVKMHQHVKFIKIGQSVVTILRFFRFFKMAAVCHHDLFGAYLDHPHRVLGGSHHSSKFGYDQCNSFYNMNVSIFDMFGWKMPIHAPKIGVWGQFNPINGLQYQPKPKSHHA